MGKPLSSALEVTSTGNTASRRLRNRLALTTMLAAMPFIGYGRQAYAACDITPPSSVSCDDTIAGASFSLNNANVTTKATPPFVVETFGLDISGNGHIQFTDNNASSITNEEGAGLSVRSTGDDPDTDTRGAVTIKTNGTITGSRDGIYAYNEGSGDISITADGTVTGHGLDGIYAYNGEDGGALTITTGVQSAIRGAQNGIDARNYGNGALSITTKGQVKSYGYDGIYAKNEGTDLKITVEATSTVDGSGDGVRAQNEGSGELNITVDGSVTSRNYDGIHAVNEEGTNLIITTGAGSVVQGLGVLDPQNPVQDSNGIDAVNEGSGYLKIKADGVVFGNLNDAIYAKNYGTDLIIETGAQSVIKGGGHGIGAINKGIGKLEITADGIVGGYSTTGDGIHAVNYDNDITLLDPYLTRDATITTGGASVVKGVEDGIDGRNYAFGNLTITAGGEVTGQSGDGIFARNVAKELYVGDESYVSGAAIGLTITTKAGSVVTGKLSGIYAEDTGRGDFLITADGRVTGETGDGIYALDGSEGLDQVYNENEDGRDFTIITGAQSVVSGGHNGITAINYGSGSLTIEANGKVTGANGDGIYATSRPFGDYEDLTITTGVGSTVTGGKDGIDAEQSGSGAFKITVNGTVTGRGEVECDCFTVGYGIISTNDNGESTEIEIGAQGLVQGSAAGIYARSYDERFIKITNDGIVRNLSEHAGDLAIRTYGGGSEIDNKGALIGTVRLADFSDTLNNDGLWITTGENSFGGGESEDILNNRGTLFGARDSAVEESPVLGGLEQFNNNGGLISLVDGQVGDELRIETRDYTSTGGHLAVDAVLGPGDPEQVKLADDLVIDGETTGTTTVHVSVVNATGANSQGIVVARVHGSADATSFVLDGPVNAGFYSWSLQHELAGVDDHIYELVSTGIGPGAAEFPAGTGGAQDMWSQSANTMLQRQMDLKSFVAGMSVTPVADFAEPVAPTPVTRGRGAPGFWFSGVGAYLEHDDQDNERKQTVWGGVAGFDFGVGDVGDALLFGVFGGYLTSKLKFDETNTEWNYEGPSVGAYATYLDGAFYANATLKVDFLDIDIDPEDLAPDAHDADTDAVNIGGRLDAGYKIGDTVFIEPQASLAVVNTEIDDVDVFGGKVEFDDATSVKGRLGVRLGVDHEAANGVIYSSDVIASVWEDFSGDNKATITTPGLPAFGVSDDPGGTMGDLSLGFSVEGPEGWSSFLRGNYQFADDYDAYSGNVGFRYAW